MNKPRPIKILKVKHRPGCTNGDAEIVCACRRAEMVDFTPKVLADLRRQAKAGAHVFLLTVGAAQIASDALSLSAPAREEIFGGGL